MKIPAATFLLLVIGGIALSSCAPTMYVQTQGDSSVALNKSALHYIVPPTPTDPVQNKDMYPIVVNAFQKNHIALTQNKKDAAYLVTWGTQDQSKEVRTIEATPSTTYFGMNNVNSYNYNYGAFGQSATGPEYAPVIRTYHMQNFTINVWKNGTQSVSVWNGSATAGAKDVKDPTTIIDDIVARYGTNFIGHTDIRAATP